MRSTFAISALSLVALTGAAASAGEPHRLVVYVFDQDSHAIVRIEDANEDGDTTDAGEVTFFFNQFQPGTGTGNSQGLFAVGPNELLATDNFEPDNVVRLRDLNGDGDAFDSGLGESSIYWNGMNPEKMTITNPVCLSPAPGGRLAVVDNNTLDTTRPESVYILDDMNGDNDVNDPDEVTRFFTLSPIGVSATTTFDGEFDNAGACYVFDITDPNQIEHIDRINPAGTTKVQWIRSDDLFSLTGVFFGPSFKLEHNEATDEIVAAVTDLSSTVYLVGLRDVNGSGFIDAANEVRLLWREGTNADGVTIGSPRDFVYAADGSLLFCDSGMDQVVRLFDGNDDGDYNDLDETQVIYTAAGAAGAGQPSANQMLSIAVASVIAPPCPADLDGDGVVGASDVALLLGAWGMPGPGDLDGNGVVGSGDVALVLGAWGGCPG